jgi:hypothetical protein
LEETAANAALGKSEHFGRGKLRPAGNFPRSAMSTMAQGCLPLRWQHEGKFEAVFASKIGAISGKLKTEMSSDISACRIPKSAFNYQTSISSFWSAANCRTPRSTGGRVLR